MIRRATEGYIVKARHIAKVERWVHSNPNQPPKAGCLDQVNPCESTGGDLKGEERRVGRIDLLSGWQPLH